ncbi:DUF4143 domain-containing protein [Glycomyces sp. L485]|uniref:ATP-binding protein n=1 Tax=Glycomyces sp. L485 TaxID=2909235 RepID=UPI001F4B7770|nr:DUF4143 domain-containing protein [Glycomyces sp. L485]MCH7229425.1 DUF4143 domain-containing protein [Glycomyces sp. L485]
MQPEYQPRLIDDLLSQRLRHHGAILLVGPRASGKTTTAARFSKTVIRLDEQRQAAVAEADPDALLRGLPEPVLIDEWQLAPQVLGAVKRAVDTDPRPGRFIVTGSVRGDLDAETWPGTGRLLRIPMYGMTVAEIQGKLPAVPLLDRLARQGVEGFATPGNGERLDLRNYAELAATGGFPLPVLRLPASEHGPWLQSYIDQLLTRDAASVGEQRDPHLLRRYFEAFCLNTAGVVDQTAIAEAAGVNRKSGDAYEGLLRNLLVVDTVPAWWTNRLKRLARAPKRYIVDPSLALAALRVDSDGLLTDGDLLGRIIDTLAMAQLRSQLSSCESTPRLFHLRHDAGRHEVDLIAEYGGGRIFAFEIKANSAPTRRDAKHLIWLRDEYGDRFIGGAVLHTGPQVFTLDEKIAAAPLATLWS